jgi:hypothetical protein
MKGILEVIKLIYGSKALSKILGTRTNVIRLPDNELKQYTKNDLNIEAASDKLAQKAKADMKELLADYPRMNDAEKLIFEGNLRRLGNKLGVTEKGSAADVLEFGTGEKVSPEGIMSLTEKAGQKSPPTTLMGNLESRVKQLEASGKDLETIAKEKGGTDLNDFFSNFAKDQKAMMKLEDQGLVRATAREIINRDIKSGKIKLPKEIEQDMVQGGGEPINVLRQFYGEDALEQLDSMIPELRNFYTAKEAADAANKKFKFEFKADRLPESISIEDAKKAEQEFNIIPADSEEGKVITEKLIGKPKASVTELVTAEKIISDMKKMDPMDAMKEANKVLKKEGKYKNLQEKDVERIMEDTNDFIFGRDIPEDPEGFAKGGRVRMAGGGILKLAMKFFNDNNPVSAYKKYLKYVKETAQKDPAKLAPEMGGVVVGSELIHRGLRRKLKEAKEKNDTDDSEDTTTEDRTEKAGGGVSQGLDYLMGIERRGYAEGGTGPRMIDGVSQEGILPGFIKRRSEFYNADGTINQEKIKAANFFYNADGTVNQVIPPTEFYYERIGKGGIGEGGGYDPKTYERIVAEGSNLYGGYSGNKISQVEDPLGLIQRLNKAGGNRTPFDNISYLPSEGGYVQWDGTSWTVTSPEMIEQRIKDWESVNYSPIQPPNTLNAQTTPTEDFSDYLNTTTINTNAQTTPAVEEQMISPEDALTPEVPSNNVLDQWKAHAEATQAMKGETGLDAIPEYGFQTGYDFQSKFPNLDPRIGAGLASGYQVLTEGLGMFNPNNPNFLNPAATYKTALSDATKNIEGIMAFDQNLMTPEQQENRNKYLKSVGQNIVQQRFPTYQQDLENYRQRQAAVDPNALRNRYLENLQNTSSQDINQFQSQLRSNLNPKGNQPQGLDYLTGL